MSASSAARLPLSLRLGYSLGAVGTGVYSTIPGVLLTFYMTDTLGIAAGVAGLAMFLPRLWDVVSDPMMGVISDRTETRWGRRRPYLLAGGLLLPVCFAALFATPVFASPISSFFYVLAWFTLCATAFTLFTVPYVAMPAEMTRDYHEGTSLMSFRMALMTVGILAGGAVAPMLIKAGGGGRAGYQLMGLVIALVIGLVMVGSFFGTRRAPFERASEDRTPFRWRAQVRGAFANPHFRSLVSTHFTVQLGIGCAIADVPYVAKYIVAGGGLSTEDIVTVIFVSLVGPTIIMMPPWVALGRRFGKRTGYRAAIVLFALGSSLMWLARDAPLWVACATTGLLGVGFAGMQLFAFSMLPDTIQAEHASSGARRDGIFSGVWLAADKGGIAVGSFIASQVLAVSGFVESQDVAFVVQPASALTGIALNISFIPTLLLLASLLALRHYRLDQRELDRLVRASSS